MLTPESNEPHEAFIGRCMADEAMIAEFGNEEHRRAASVSLWERVNPVPRQLKLDRCEMRLDEDAEPRLTGYAAKYGIQTDIGGWFKEKIKDGAFGEAIENDDVRALKNHDPNLLLGRTASGTLRLASNTVGLRFEIDVPDTTTGRDTVVEVRRGDLKGCSFSFTVAEDKWTHYDDGRPSERTIVKIGRLFDVGPVTFPAYEATSVAVRSLYAPASPPAGPDEPEATTVTTTTNRLVLKTLEIEPVEQRTEETPPAEALGEAPEEQPDEISPERARQIEYDDQEMGRLIRHVEQKNQSPEV